ESHARIQSTGRQRRDSAGRVSHQQAMLIGDAAKNSTDRYAAPATLDQFCVAEIDYVVHAVAKLSQRLERVEARGIATDTEVNLFAVVNDPGEITRSDVRIKKAVKARRSIHRHAVQYFFHAHDPFAVAIEFERRTGLRCGSVRSHEVASANATRLAFSLNVQRELVVQFCILEVSGRRRLFL